MRRIRCGLGTRRARLAVLEQHSADTAGLLTERTARPHRHVEAAQPGDLLSLDTFYVDKLKGVGKVWQITGGWRLDRVLTEAAPRLGPTVGDAGPSPHERVVESVNTFAKLDSLVRDSTPQASSFLWHHKPYHGRPD